MNQKLIDQIKVWQRSSKIVLVTGVFDIIHIEHIRFLTKAKAAGNTLIVGIESDARVTAMKGEGRPLNNQEIRKEQLEALTVVDLVFILPENFSTQTDWEEFMKEIKPDIYAVSSHSTHIENKRKICQKFNIDFRIVHDFNPHHSSSQLINQLTEKI